jgi:hypothetical protein
MKSLGYLWLALLSALCTSVYAGTCASPDKSIESFLVRFAGEKAFQRDRIVYPMRIKYMPPGSEDWKTERWPRSRVDKIDWPLFLSQAELKSSGYEQTIKRHNDNHVTVRHDSGGDAYVRVFEFRNLKGCWNLVFLADYSL